MEHQTFNVMNKNTHNYTQGLKESRYIYAGAYFCFLCQLNHKKENEKEDKIK